MNNVELKKLHEYLYEISSEVKKICIKYNIKYYLLAGSALGAVRHNEIIPWDDDVDIGMTRLDYERFLNIAINELPKKYMIQNYNTDSDMPLPYTKIRLANSLALEECDRFSSGNKGIFIDIFPLDRVPSSPIKKSFHKFFIFFSTQLLMKKSNYRPYDRSFYKRIFYDVIIGILSFLFSRSFLIRLNEFVQSYVNSQSSEKLVVVGGSYGYDKETVNADWFREHLLMSFGGEMYPVPQSYHDYLSWLYSDYLELPPEVDREPRHTFLELKFPEDL